MDQDTQNFVDGCLSRAAQEIGSRRQDVARTAQVEVLQIRARASAALERLESGQVTAALNFKGARYMG